MILKVFIIGGEKIYNPPSEKIAKHFIKDDLTNILLTNKKTLLLPVHHIHNGFEWISLSDNSSVYTYMIGLAKKEPFNIEFTIANNKANLYIRKSKYPDYQEIDLVTYKQLYPDIDLNNLKKQIKIAAKHGVDISDIPKELQPYKESLQVKESFSEKKLNDNSTKVDNLNRNDGDER